MAKGARFPVSSERVFLLFGAAALLLRKFLRAVHRLPSVRLYVYTSKRSDVFTAREVGREWKAGGGEVVACLCSANT